MQSTLLLSLNAALALVAVVALAWTLAKAKRAKRAQERLIESLGAEGSDAWFRVNVSRPEHFGRRMKLMGFEAKGVLVNSADRIRILAELPSGQRIDRTFLKRDLALEWLGNTGIASANMHWISVGPRGQSLVLSADTGFNALQSRESTADLCRIIDPHFRLPAIAKADFALEKNPASLTAVVAMFGLLGFAIVDGVFVNENELLTLGDAFWGLAAVPLLAVPWYRWLTRMRVPSRESLSLTMFIGMALVAAYIPAIKRIDQVLATDDAPPVAYRLGADASLEPVTPGPPRLNYRRIREYWAQFDEGSIHHFSLTRGPLGLWQLDHTRLDEAVRAFYETRDEGKPGSR